MTRQIKFRGLRTDGKGWVYGYYFYDRYVEEHYIIDDFTNVQVLPEYVGQFTGLYDKNGIEIYDGDRISDHIGFGYIEYCNSGVRVNYSNGSCKWLYDYMRNEFETIEIIGNIHESEVQNES